MGGGRYAFPLQNIHRFRHLTTRQSYNTRKDISELYASFLLHWSWLGCNVNTRRMSQPDMGSIFHIKKNKRNILVKGNYYVNYQNFQNSMLISSSDIKRTLMDLFLLTNSNHRELVSICTQNIRIFPCIITLATPAFLGFNGLNLKNFLFH